MPPFLFYVRDGVKCRLFCFLGSEFADCAFFMGMCGLFFLYFHKSGNSNENGCGGG